MSDLSELHYGHDDSKIAEIFGWYNLVGYSCQALGAFFAGYAISFCQSLGISVLESHRFILYSYAYWGLAKFVLYNELSRDVELSEANNNQVEEEAKCGFGIKRKSTCKAILILSALFALDAFAGGFIVNSFISYWFWKEWNVN